MWDLPGPGLEPASPALAGGFLTTVPPGTSRYTHPWSDSTQINFSSMSCSALYQSGADLAGYILQAPMLANLRLGLTNGITEIGALQEGRN